MSEASRYTVGRASWAARKEKSSKVSGQNCWINVQDQLTNKVELSDLIPEAVLEFIHAT